MTPQYLIRKWRKISQARSEPGKWEADTSHSLSGRYAEISGLDCNDGFVPVADANFIVLSDRILDPLLDVAEAALRHPGACVCPTCKALARLAEVGRE